MEDGSVALGIGLAAAVSEIQHETLMQVNEYLVGWKWGDAHVSSEKCLAGKGGRIEVSSLASGRLAVGVGGWDLGGAECEPCLGSVLSTAPSLTLYASRSPRTRSNSFNIWL